MSSDETDWKLEHCPALTAIKVISGKWKTRVLWLLRTQPMQFGQLRRHLKGVSAKMLTEHLRQMEADGLIDVHFAIVNGNRISIYSYSAYGAGLVPLLDALGEWGLAHERRRQPET